MKENMEIRTILIQLSISYTDLLEFIPDKKYTSRICEELKLPLSEERKKVYLDAIEKVKQKRIEELSKI